MIFYSTQLIGYVLISVFIDLLWLSLIWKTTRMRSLFQDCEYAVYNTQEVAFSAIWEIWKAKISL